MTNPKKPVVYFDCECGTTVRMSSRARHRKSEKHARLCGWNYTINPIPKIESLPTLPPENKSWLHFE